MNDTSYGWRYVTVREGFTVDSSGVAVAFTVLLAVPV